jgi:hypothetical protein
VLVEPCVEIDAHCATISISLMNSSYLVARKAINYEEFDFQGVLGHLVAVWATKWPFVLVRDLLVAV